MRIDKIKKSKTKQEALEYLAELRDLKKPGAQLSTIHKAERLIEKMYP